MALFNIVIAMETRPPEKLVDLIEFLLFWFNLTNKIKKNFKIKKTFVRLELTTY